jgi:NosR/NirI family nitrous oxide reductase transcriptional regulator
MSRQQRRFIGAGFKNNSNSTLRNVKTRRTSRVRLVLVTVLLLSVVSWSSYTYIKVSEAAAAAAATDAEEARPVSSALYGLSSETLSKLVPGNYRFVKSHGNPPYYTVVDHDAQTGQNVTEGYVFVTTDVAPSWSYGYSGPVSTLVSMDSKGVVLSVEVLYYVENRPGGAFDEPWLSTLVGKNVLGNYTVGEDIDAVSGATYTSMAVVSGIREGGRAVLKDAQSSLSPPPKPSSHAEQIAAMILNLTTPKDYIESLFLLGLISVSVIGIVKKVELLRYGVLLGSLGLMEFIGTRMISISDMLNLRSLALPPLQGNLFWYLLLGSAAFLSLIWGRVYCGWLCPFGAATEFLNMLAGWLPRSRIKMPLRVCTKTSVIDYFLTRFRLFQFMVPVSVRGRVASVKSVFERLLGKLVPLRSKIPLSARPNAFFVKYLVLAAVVWGVVMARNLAITGVEPFVTFFFAEGTIWMWLVLFAVLLASLRVNRVFCRYICPTGAVLSLLAWLRVREIKRWPECSTCRICQRDCIMGGIRGERIPAADCFNCGACERNYENAQGCPHWLRLRPSRAAT